MNLSVEELFHKLAGLSAGDRELYFEQHNIDDLARREVEQLLAFDSCSGASLDRDIGHVAQRALARFEPEGLKCGPYRLGDLLGSGGMGAVYAGERVDGEVAQRVAVKLLRPGADDTSSRQRFLAERQILATLSHPNIARLLDAGHLEDGRPYLVMEYIDGQPIDVYASGFGVRQKIALFLKVCAAVGYLHRNLVVHRDLKPGNVLVTSEGEPKLVDFGIAKMLDVAADSAATTMRMLTPGYASPEQATGRPLTTATDIYSLGAVLYKLLTGAAPHQCEAGSPDAIAPAISQASIAPPSRLMSGLKGDLEIILMKALRPDPQERYSSVERFSGDLENYLASRPIRARKDSAWYRTRKFLSRQWLPAAAVAISIAGLTAGALAVNHERTIAQRRFLQVRQLAQRLFDIDAEVRRVPGTTGAREMIVSTSLEYLRRLAAEAHGDPDVALELANAYLRLARIEGLPSSVNLGRTDRAGQNLQLGEQFVARVLAARPANRTALLRSAEIAHDRMILARHSRRSDDALAFARTAEKWLEKFDARPSDAPEGPAILSTYASVAEQYMLAGHYGHALAACRRAADLARALNLPAHLGSLLTVSAEVSRRRGDLDEALRNAREAVRIMDAAPGERDRGRVMNLVLALIDQGRILGEDGGISMGRCREAVVSLERAFRLADNFAHQDRNDRNSRDRLATAGLLLADILRRSDAPKSVSIYDHVLRHTAEAADDAGLQRYQVRALAGSSFALLRLGRPAEARRRIQGAFERLKRLKLYPAAQVEPGLEVEKALRASAGYEARLGRIRRAIEINDELFRKIMLTGPNPETSLTDAVELSHVYAASVTLNRRLGRQDRAAEAEVRLRELWNHWDTRLPHNSFIRHQLVSIDPHIRRG